MMTRPRYSMPELERPWDRLRQDQKFQVLREDVAAIREALDAILANLGMAQPQDNFGRYPRTQSKPSVVHLCTTVDDLQHDMKDVLHRLDAVERSK